MLNFLATNLGNIIVGAILILMVALVIVSLVRKKKKGQTTCGCGCSHCVMYDSCHGNRGKYSVSKAGGDMIASRNMFVESEKRHPIQEEELIKIE